MNEGTGADVGEGHECQEAVEYTHAAGKEAAAVALM